MASDGRGRYDRRKSTRTRRRETRTRVLAATALLLTTAGPESPNVARITDLASIGRNTFYQLFRSGLAARRAAERTAMVQLGRILDEGLASASTPIERLRGLASAWLRAADDTSPLVRLAILEGSGADHRPAALERRLRDVLEQALRAGVTSTRPVDPRLRLVSAAWQGMARETAGAARATTALEHELVDFTLRVFR